MDGGAAVRYGFARSSGESMSSSERQPITLSVLLKEAKENPAPVYLFTGEPARIEAAARALIHVLLPPEERTTQLEVHDGRDVQRLADSLRMTSLFGGGRKVVWVREPVFLARQTRPAETAGEMFAAWEEGHRKGAAERLLRLAAAAGWSHERFVETEWEELSESEAEKLLGKRPDAGERAVLAEVARFARDLGRPVSEFRDDAGNIEAVLASGPAPGVVLLLTASALDRRQRLFRLIQKSGRVLELAVERERSGTLSPASVREALREVLTREGRTIDRDAAELIERRAGSDFGAVLAELEKLCLYVGDRKRITREDVERSFADMSGAWVFDLTRALAERKAADALRLLRGVLDGGEPPLRLVALLAREIRTLLLARDCLNGSLARQWRPGIPYTTFRDRLLPRLTEEEREAFGKIHPYVLFLALQNSSRIPPATLERALRRLHEIDLRLKSSGADPRLLLERFVLEATGHWQ